VCHTDAMTPLPLLTLDSRRRVALGKLARHERYMVELKRDGTLILTPAVVISAQEADFHRNHPDEAAKIMDDMQHPERLVRHTEA
jgi:hypothetical protein